MEAGRIISLQSASKRFPSFGHPANGNKNNSKKSYFAQIETQREQYVIDL